jgi:DNA-binding NarL/FixJ family response regulator
VTEGAARVLIVDDDGGFRAEVARVLARGGFEVQEASTGDEALGAAMERPVAVVLEVVLPDADGLEVCRELRDRHGQSLPVIMVSGERSEPHDRVAGLLVGADDYLVKPVNGDELLIRLRRLLSRNGARPAAAVANGPGGLSPRETEILCLLAGGLGAVAISERLVISRKTVASHLQHVMAKLGVHSRAHAVAEAYRLGLVGDRDSEPGPPLSAVP